MWLFALVMVVSTSIVFGIEERCMKEANREAKRAEDLETDAALTENEKHEIRVIDGLARINKAKKGRKICLWKINDNKSTKKTFTLKGHFYEDSDAQINVTNAKLSLSDTKNKTCNISSLDLLNYEEIEVQCDAKVYRNSNINTIETNEVDPNEYQNIANWVRRAFVQWSQLSGGKDYKLKRVLNITQLVQKGIIYVIRSEVMSPEENLTKNCTVIFSRSYLVFAGPDFIVKDFHFLIKCGIDSTLITIGGKEKDHFSHHQKDLIEMFEDLAKAVLVKVNEENNVAYRFNRILGYPRSRIANGRKYFLTAEITTPYLEIKECYIEYWEQDSGNAQANFKCDENLYGLYSKNS